MLSGDILLLSATSFRGHFAHWCRGLLGTGRNPIRISLKEIQKQSAIGANPLG